MRRFPISWDKTITALGFKRKLRHQKKGSDYGRRSAMRLEALEPKVVLSADPLTGGPFYGPVASFSTSTQDPAAEPIELEFEVVGGTGAEYFDVAKNVDDPTAFKVTIKNGVDVPRGETFTLKVEERLGELAGGKRYELKITIHKQEFVDAFRQDRIDLAQEEVDAIEQTPTTGGGDASPTDPNVNDAQLEELYSEADFIESLGDDPFSELVKQSYYESIAETAEEVIDSGLDDGAGNALLLLTDELQADINSGNTDLATSAQDLLDQLSGDTDHYYTVWTGLGINHTLIHEENIPNILEYTFSLYESGEYEVIDGVSVDLGTEASIEAASANQLSFSSSFAASLASAITILGEPDVRDTTWTDYPMDLDFEGMYAAWGGEVSYNDGTNPTTYHYLDAVFGFDLSNHLGGFTASATATLHSLTVFPWDLLGTYQNLVDYTYQYWEESPIDLNPLAADAFSPNATPITVDAGTSFNVDMTEVVQRAMRFGDANLDGQIDVDDIDAFHAAVTNLADYYTQYGLRASYENDIIFSSDSNWDSIIDLADVDAFFDRTGEAKGDFDGSGTVDAADHAIWVENYNQTNTRYSEGDGNFDGVTNIADYSVWHDNEGNNRTTPKEALASLRLRDVDPADNHAFITYATSEWTDDLSQRPSLDFTVQPDLVAKQFSTNLNDLSVVYNIVNEDFSSLNIEVYRSSDGVTLDQLLMTQSTDPADRLVGHHEVEFEANFANDVDEDYQLIVKLVGTSTSGDSEYLDTNNTVAFSGGIFKEADGTIQVHGTNENDSVSVLEGKVTLTSDSGFQDTYYLGGIDFNDYALVDYANQTNSIDGNVPLYEVQDDGATLYLENNMWRAIDLGTNFQVTANTVIEFDYTSTVEGEFHGFGFDNDLNATGTQFFRLHGIQQISSNWQEIDEPDYEQSDGTRHYKINVGEFYTGNFNYLLFAADNDEVPGTGNSVFSNVRVYESGDENSAVSNVYVRAQGGDDTVTTDADGQTQLVAFGGVGDDDLQGGVAFANEIYGGAGNDIYRTATGTFYNVFYEDEGDDQYVFTENTTGHAIVLIDPNGTATGNDTFDFSSLTVGVTVDLEGSGNQDLFGNASLLLNFDSATNPVLIENIVGTGFDDTLSGSDLDNLIDAGGGVDIVHGREGNDTVFGGNGNDTIYGNEGDDYLDGEDGSDSIYGNEGFDSIYGSLGDDSILNGGDDDDFVSGGEGIDLLVGGLGDDVLYGNEGDDVIFGLEGNDTLIGYLGNDILFGGDDDDTLVGDAGDDELQGGLGDDKLLGGDGNDTLNGGGENDLHNGGIGADDFEVSVGDEYLEDLYFDDDQTPTLSNGGQNNIVPAFGTLPNVVSIVSGQEYSLALNADPGEVGQNITYTLIGDTLPMGATFQNGTFTWMPTNADDGTRYSLVVSATDNGTPQAVSTVQINIDVQGSLEELDVMPKTNTISSSSILVSWNSVISATGYEVQRRRTNSSTWTTFSTANSQFIDTDLDPGSRYEYRVRAIKHVLAGSDIYGNYSNELSEFTSINAPVITSLTEIDNNEARVEWTYNSGSSTFPNPERFRIEVLRDDGGNARWKSLGNESSTRRYAEDIFVPMGGHVGDNNNAGEVGVYRVVAVGTNGIESFSDPVIIETKGHEREADTAKLGDPISRVEIFGTPHTISSQLFPSVDADLIDEGEKAFQWYWHNSLANTDVLGFEKAFDPVSSRSLIDQGYAIDGATRLNFRFDDTRSSEDVLYNGPGDDVAIFGIEWSEDTYWVSLDKYSSMGTTSAPNEKEIEIPATSFVRLQDYTGYTNHPDGPNVLGETVVSTFDLSDFGVPVGAIVEDIFLRGSASTDLLGIAAIGRPAEYYVDLSIPNVEDSNEWTAGHVIAVNNNRDEGNFDSSLSQPRLDFEQDGLQGHRITGADDPQLQRVTLDLFSNLTLADTNGFLEPDLTGYYSLEFDEAEILVWRLEGNNYLPVTSLEEIVDLSSNSGIQPQLDGVNRTVELLVESINPSAGLSSLEAIFVPTFPAELASIYDTKGVEEGEEYEIKDTSLDDEAWDGVRFITFNADLQIGGLNSTAEIEPGFFLGTNNDDDNVNSIPDYQDIFIVGGDDDLELLQLAAVETTAGGLFSSRGGDLTLDFDNNKIRIWTDVSKSIEVLPGDIIDRTISHDFYVEGILPSTSFGDVEIISQLNPFPSSFSEAYLVDPVPLDSVKITVIDIDLEIDGLDNLQEHLIGADIEINDDFSKGMLDNGTPIPDNQRDPGTGEWIFDASDLGIMTPATLTWNLGVHHDLDIVLDYPDDVLVWKVDMNSQNGVLIESGVSFRETQDSLNLLIEGLSQSDDLQNTRITAKFVEPYNSISVVDTDEARYRVDADPVDNNIEGNLHLEGVAESNEETTGGLVFYNDNDSDETDLADLTEDFRRPYIDPDWLSLDIDPVSSTEPVYGDYSLNFTSGIRIWQENPDGTFDYILSGALIDAEQPPTLFVEGFNPDAEEEITLDFIPLSGGIVQDLDKVKVTVERALIQISKIQDDKTSDDFNDEKKVTGEIEHLEHDKALDKKQGAYIPLNNDDDDYDGELDNKATQSLSDQENDLLPIYVHNGNTDTGNGEFIYKLDHATSLRMWRDVNGKKQAVPKNSLIDFSGEDVLKFYVDAKDAKTSAQKIELEVIHAPTGKSFKQLLYANIFEISGPLNVPDYSVYQYDVTSNRVAGRSDTMWLSPGFGELREDDQEPNTDQNKDIVKYYWSTSPVIAKARYQATVDFVWARDINVVKVEAINRVVQTAGLGSPQQHSTFYSNNNLGTGDPLYVISNVGNQQAMESEVTIRAQGPTRVSSGQLPEDATQRGLDHLEIGYIQHLNTTTQKATYKEPFGGVITREHNLKGNKFLDGITLWRKDGLVPTPPPFSLNENHYDGRFRSSKPWYDSQGITNDSNIEGYYDLKDEELTSGQVFTKVLDIGDSPLIQVAPALNITIGSDVYKLESVDLVIEFDTYVAVAIKDQENKQFDQRAAFTWQFNGTGDYLGTTTWGGIGHGNTDTSFIEVKDGSTVPDDVYQDANGNDQFYNDVIRSNQNFWQ